MNKTHTCDQCGRSFTTKTSLKLHQRIHTGEKPYNCDECGKDFKSLGELKSHRRIHTGERPYHCVECGKDFKTLGELKSHQRRHTGEKPYSCDEWGKALSTLGSLKIHQSIHTGEKPCICDEYEKTFLNLSALKNHQLIHRCDQRDKGFIGSNDVSLHQNTCPHTTRLSQASTLMCHLPTNHPSFSTYPGQILRGRSRSRKTQTSLSPATSFSSSGGTPRSSQATRETQSFQHVLGLPQGLLPVVASFANQGLNHLGPGLQLLHKPHSTGPLGHFQQVVGPQEIVHHNGVLNQYWSDLSPRGPLETLTGVNFSQQHRSEDHSGTQTPPPWWRFKEETLDP